MPAVCIVEKLNKKHLFLCHLSPQVLFAILLKSWKSFLNLPLFGVIHSYSQPVPYGVWTKNKWQIANVASHAILSLYLHAFMLIALVNALFVSLLSLNTFNDDTLHINCDGYRKFNSIPSFIIIIYGITWEIKSILYLEWKFTIRMLDWIHIKTIWKIATQGDIMFSSWPSLFTTKPDEAEENEKSDKRNENNKSTRYV